MNEEELKEEIEKLEKKLGHNLPLKTGFEIEKLKAKLKTLQERNAEVKQIIEESRGMFVTDEAWRFFKQKLGLECVKDSLCESKGCGKLLGDDTSFRCGLMTPNLKGKIVRILCPECLKKSKSVTEDEHGN